MGQSRSSESSYSTSVPTSKSSIVHTLAEQIKIHQSKANNALLYFCVFATCVHGLGWGCSVAYPGLVLPHHLEGNYNFIQLGKEQGSWFISATPLAITVGVLLGIPLANQLGRKSVLIISNLLQILGYILICSAHGFGLLLTGRLITGLGSGVA